jgi:hypothetical protein
MAKMGCAKCGGTKKMALGGSAVKKAPVQLYGIPQQNMGTSSQMGFGKKGGSVRKMEVGGSSKASTASKAAPKTVTTKGKKVMNAAQIKAARVTAVERSGKAAPGAAAKYGDIKLKNKRTVSAPAPTSAKYGPVTRNAAIKTNAGKISTVTKDAAKAAAVKLNMNRQLVDKLKTGEKLKARVAKPGPNFKSNVAKTVEKFKNASNVGNEWKAEAALLKNEAKLLAKGSSAKKLLVGAGIVAATYGAKKLYDYATKQATKPAVKPVVKKDTKVTIKPVVKPVASTKVDTNKNGTKITTSTSTAPITSTTSTPSTTPATTVKKAAVKKAAVKKAAVKKVVKKAATPVATVDKMAVKKPSASGYLNPKTGTYSSVLDTKKPADLKLIESKAKETAVENTTEKAKPAKTKSAISTGPSESFANKIRGAINDSRLRRAERAIEKGDKERSDALLNKIKESESKMKKGGSTKSKKK